jgi:hypothetical protein
MDELRLKIHDLRKFRSQEGPYTLLPFVPEAGLFSLLSRGTISNALADSKFRLESHQREPTANEVVDGARKIFAILVELRLEDKLKKCLEKCLTDSTLPVVEEKRLGDIFPESVAHFERLQWEYIPLKFRQGAHKDLEPGRILPYVKNTKKSSGGFSTIFNITIHPSYQDWYHLSRASVSHTLFEEGQTMTFSRVSSLFERKSRQVRLTKPKGESLIFCFCCEA